jgi:hypothetical protein
MMGSLRDIGLAIGAWVSNDRVNSAPDVEEKASSALGVPHRRIFFLGQFIR